MAKAQQTINVGDNVYITDPGCPANYGKVKAIGEELITVETTGNDYEIEPGFLEVDELQF